MRDYSVLVLRSAAPIVALIVFFALTGCVYHPLFSREALDGAGATSRAETKRSQLAKIVQARSRMSLPSTTVVPLPSPDLQLTPEVKREMALLRQGQFIRKSVERRDEHIPVLQEIFRDEGLPPEISNVGLIESGFRPDARSGAGAVGMWQLMKSTAKMYGLKVNFFEDQRKDPILSSLAAARHLRDLYFLYNDWNLALAAYNAGPGSIDRALLRARTANFWDLAHSGKLNSETARFVPRFIASCLLVQEHAAETLTAQKNADLNSNLG